MREDISLEFLELVEKKTVIRQEESRRQQNGRPQNKSRLNRRRRIKRRRIIIRLAVSGVLLAAATFLLFCLISMLVESGIGTQIRKVIFSRDEGVESRAVNTIPHPAWTEDYLTVNEYSRPGKPLRRVKDIFVHYTANPGTNAVQNRSYFEQLKDTHERAASAHFIIGCEGDILLCIPLNEMAYAVKTRNEDSISIECCYLNEDGSFTQETYDSLIELLAWLLQEYDLDADHILRHYDCGGKKCPLYYTEHEDAWEKLKQDVAVRISSDA